ncbi:MAG: nuclear transport factor 2 family protein [Pseudomonadales bacterium]|nr:nuclear transport factor 2 family protein [Pseudomonadales bacterium]
MSRSDETYLRKQNQIFESLFNTNELDSIMQLFEEDAMLLLPGVPLIRGRSAILETFRFMKTKIDKISNHTEEIHISGITAIEVGHYQHFDLNGKPLDEGKFLVVWKKVAGAWLISKDSVSSNGR